MSEVTPWRRLHPASVWVNALPRTLKSIAAMWWLLIPLFAQEDTARVGAIEVVLILVVFGTGLFSSFVHYSTLRYRMHENMLEIRYGLLNRRSRRLDPMRIQNLELIRNPLHKMSGLVELCVETAGEAREEGEDRRNGGGRRERDQGGPGPRPGAAKEGGGARGIQQARRQR